MSRSVAIALLVLLAMAALAGAAWGLAGEALDRRVREISDGLRCPTCQSISVNDSEAAFSRQIRGKVRRMLQEGQDEQQIWAFFESRYGEWILRAPKKEGLGLVLWLLPGLLIAGVGAWIAFNVYKLTSTTHAAAADTQPLAKAEQERIERDLVRFEEED